MNEKSWHILFLSCLALIVRGNVCVQRLCFQQVNWGRGKPLLEFDLARTARNGLIGAFFGPLVCYYYDFSDFILPMDVPANRVLKIIMVRSLSRALSRISAEESLPNSCMFS